MACKSGLDKCSYLLPSLPLHFNQVLNNYSESGYDTQGLIPTCALKMKTWTYSNQAGAANEQIIPFALWSLGRGTVLSHFSRVRLCATPSLGLSRQEHWSGLPFSSPMHKSEKWKWSRSVMPDSSQPHRLQPTRLLHSWDFPGKSTGVGCHCLLREEGRPSLKEVERLLRVSAALSSAAILNIWASKC